MTNADSRELAARLARLSPEQRALLQRKLKSRADADPELAPRRGDRSRSPLGLDQERLWILDQLDPGSHTYNISVGLRFVGELDTEVFTAAVAAIVRRHDLLRSSVAVQDGRPVLQVHEELPSAVELIDLRAQPEQLDETVRTLVRRPFDLLAGGLLRVAVLRLADDEYQIVETMHHSVTDQWSYVRFNRELLEHYRALLQGRPAQLAELPVQFGDFAQWQREYFSGARQQRHRDFWRTELTGAPELLALPYDAPPNGVDYTGAHHYFLLDDDVSAHFLAAGRAGRATLSDALLAVYVALLHEETGQHDIVVGLAGATRARPETHELIGFFLTNVPIRVRLPEHPTPAQILAATKAASAAVADHREVPFSEIVEAVSPERTLDRYPLLQTMHLVLDFDDTVFEVPGAEVYATEVEDGVSPMDITLGWWRAGTRLYGRFEYRTALFTPETVDRLAHRLMGLVRDFAERVDEPLVVSRVRSTTVLGSTGPALTPVPAPDTAELARVAEIWRGILGHDVGPDEDFFQAGGTSIMAIELSHALRAAGFAITARGVFNQPTMAGQLGLLSAGSESARPVAAVAGAVSPEQEDLLEAGLPSTELWSHTLVLASDRPLDPEVSLAAVERVVAAHPGLCTAFRRTEQGWRASTGEQWSRQVAEPGAEPAQVAAAQRAGFDVEQGQLFAAALLPGEVDRIVLTANHLVVDGFSWGVLVGDLARALRGEQLPPEPVPALAHAAALRGYDFGGQLDYWRAQQAAAAPLACRTGGSDRLAGETEFAVRVPLPAAAASWTAEALTAVGRAVRCWTPGDDVVLDVVAPGRDFTPAAGWDPMRAVGYHACAYPLRLPLGGDPAGQLALVGEALDAVPDGGKGYGALRWSADPAVRAEVQRWPRVEISFNYLGSLLGESPHPDGLFRTVAQLGPDGNGSAVRHHAVDVLVGIESGSAVFTWRYNPEAVEAESIRSAAGTAAAEFARLATGRRGVSAGVAGMSLDSVNDMFARISRDRREGMSS
ncbi:condensation domain-containing protein [Kitasatospora aureofaciens]|uniref:condensation domain-containing protein n=1 Tax=Kitasatospora aureofaciens TaxID=1894 RepID=UPI0038059FD0